MQTILAATIPTLLILVLGSVLRRKYLPDRSSWRAVEISTYYLFTPALFAGSIGVADLSLVPLLPLAVTLALPTLAVTCLLMLSKRPARWSGPEFTSVIQGSIRINTYVGLTFAGALHGSQGVAAFALACAVTVPLVNIICVSILAACGNKGYDDRPSLWRELATNPLILGCAAGLLINVTGLPLPDAAAATLKILGTPALVCGTLAAGAAMTFKLRAKDTAAVLITSTLKLAALPLAAAAIGLWLALPTVVLQATVIICALPTAPSATILAARMGGDVRLIASITGVQSILSMATIPALLAATNP